MKLVMTLLVRDEEDILAANLEYHLRRGVDHFVVTDNGSGDGTREILERYRRLGVLSYSVEEEDTFAQARWVTRMARQARTGLGADWVINNDADEFWWPEGGSLNEVLAAVPPEVEACVAPRGNFPPRSWDGGESFVEDMTVRQVASVNALGMPLPPKVCHRAYADIDVAQGNHGVSRLGRELAAAAVPITIFHFPLRSYGQFANKIAKGGGAYQRNAELSPQVGCTWRSLYEIWQQGGLPAYYRREMLDHDGVEAGIRAGRLVRDERLRDFFRARGIGAGEVPR